MIEFDTKTSKFIKGIVLTVGVLIAIAVLSLFTARYLSRYKLSSYDSSDVLGVTSESNVRLDIIAHYEKMTTSKPRNFASNISNVARTATLGIIELFDGEREKREYLFKKRLRQLKTEEIRRFYARYGYPPLYDYAEVFVDAAEIYGLDYRLLPAISIIESGGGRNLFRPYNPFGWGYKSFSSFEEAIYYVAFKIRRYYYDLGWREPEVIAYKYNGPTPQEWGRKAKYLVSLMRSEETLRKIVESELNAR